MAKTKEEVLKILESNYIAVQNKELNVYDNAQSLRKTFNNDVKKLDGLYKESEKDNNQQDKTITSNHKTVVKGINSKHKEHLEDVEKRSVTGKNTLENALVEANNKQQAAITDNTAITEVINKENKTLVAAVLKQYKSDIAKSEKVIATINEKAVKDNKSFEQKVSDLKSKHESVIVDLNDKEKSKIAKITENSNKTVQSLQEGIEKQRTAYEDNLATLKPIYEEELAEIDENLADAKSEYETKHESIRSSADQRIAVREKHLHRAMDEKDSRSIKAHKKDIEKFRKEADKDLVVLRKKFNQDNAVALDYRKNFIKENFEKLAVLEKDFSKLREGKQLEIDQAVITLSNDVKNTELEYEKLRAEELNKYNKLHEETNEKQIEFERESQINLEKEDNTQKVLKINLDKDNAQNEQKHKTNLEKQAKELRDIDLIKNKEDALANDVFNVLTVKLDNEIAVANIELAKDLNVDHIDENIEHHAIQDQRHAFMKDDFSNYQKSLEPLYIKRSEELCAYEELEIANRHNLKVNLLEKQRVEVKTDFETLTEKITTVLTKEVKFFNQQIEKIAGPEKLEFEEYVNDKEAQIEVLNQKLNSLDPRKDKRARKQAQDELDTFKEQFISEKAQKEVKLDQSISILKQAVKDATNRKDIALEEAKQLFELENSGISNAIELINNTKEQELTNAKLRKDETTQRIQDFLNKATSRNQMNSDENQTYLENTIDEENGIKNQTISDFEANREKLNNNLSEALSNLDSVKNEMLEKASNDLKQQEQELESFISNSESNISSLDAKANNDVDNQSSTFKLNVQNINTAFDNKVKSVQEELADLVGKYNTHLSDISTRLNEESAKFESEKKRVVKEYDLRIKEDIQKIDGKLKTDISSIE